MSQTITIYGWIVQLIEQGRITRYWTCEKKPMYIRPGTLRVGDIREDQFEITTAHTLILKEVLNEAEWNLAVSENLNEL